MSKQLVICCDGTWNRLDQRKHDTPTATNVAKVARGLAETDADGQRQMLFYIQGVGTRRFERLRGGAFGLGLSRNVRACYRFLVENYEPGDRLYFFGFSRGAFTARSTAGLVRNAGILRREHASRVDEAYRLYRADGSASHPRGAEARSFRRSYSHPDTDIHFIGVWDTVGALGIPTGPLRLRFLTDRWSFHDTDLSSHVRFAYHALAIDERRKPFKPTLWRRPDEAAQQTLEQVWFAGVHSDIGGGYPEAELADISLLWMAERARDAGLAFEPRHFKDTPPPLDAERRALGQQVAPDALGLLHDSRKGIYRLQRRYVRELGGDGGGVASSALERLGSAPRYDAPNLEKWANGKRRTVSAVEDSAATVTHTGGPSMPKEVNPSVWLVGSIAVATATLAFFGVEGDGLSRLIRIHPWWLLAGAGLLLVALSIGFLTLSERPAKGLARGAQCAGLCAFLAGTGLVLWAHADATGEQQRPTVAAGLDADSSGMTAKVRLTAAGLKPDEYLFVIVQGANSRRHLDPERAGPVPGKPEPITNGGFSLQRLYKGRVGPSPGGDVNVSLAVPVSHGQYDQVWAKTRIITSGGALVKTTGPTETSAPELTNDAVDEEKDVEHGQAGFPCSRETVDTACAVLLVPLPPITDGPDR